MPLSENQAGSQRLFFALWPPADVRAALGALLPSVQGRRIPVDNLHITMAFLGQQPSERVPALRAIANTLYLADTTLIIDQLGYFSGKRIAWAGMRHPPASLMATRRTLVDAIKQAGLAFDASLAFRPHVTLAREASAPALTQIAPIRWQADRVVLVSSRPGAAGVVYTVMND